MNVSGDGRPDLAKQLTERHESLGRQRKACRRPVSYCQGVTDRVQCRIADGVADVRLDRPEKLNALDDAMFTVLTDTGAALRDEPGLRAVVLSGNGRSFCAGLDRTAFQAMDEGRNRRPACADAAPSDPDGLSRGQRAVPAWHTLPVPVIAAVRGHMAFTSPLAAGLAAERESLHTIMGSPNQQEAAAAALAGRTPTFTDGADA
jgi:hypothetical protein